MSTAPETPDDFPRSCRFPELCSHFQTEDLVKDPFYLNRLTHPWEPAGDDPAFPWGPLPGIPV